MEAIIVDTPYKVAGGGAWRLECFFLELESTTQSWWGFGLVGGSVVPPISGGSRAVQSSTRERLGFVYIV